MTKDLIQINYRQELVADRFLNIKYIAEITRHGLDDYAILTSDDSDTLKKKVKTYISEILNKELTRALSEIDNILLDALKIEKTLNWEQFKDKTVFSILPPEEELNKLLSGIKKPKEPKYIQLPKKPEFLHFQPKLSFFDSIIKSKKDVKIEQAYKLFEEALQNWKIKSSQVDDKNQTLKERFQQEILIYETQIEEIKQKNLERIKKWENQKADFILMQDETNAKVDSIRELYLSLNTSSVIEYCDMILKKSIYPESFPKDYEMEYYPDSKILIIDYSLPSIEQLPTLSEVRVIKEEIKEYHISDSEIAKMFDNTMYNITLRTIHELFEADIVNAIEAISFNGWVNAINKATGKHENNCILSIQAKKSEFVEINLSKVDPKTCFKNFKGVGSSKLSGLTAIQPILQISKTDKRFTNHYEVVDSIDNSTNLASMNWEDFEHLIREVFGKEFSSNGGEVKVTQASRDGGVDAIAFDPDPIRGGKIVIQAKRYTNTVGVSAVRDLYGTVMNEGATKGILVTTADYGPDAYDFVKGKPLTLMNGANLLYLLERHGHQARIDIKEARENMR